MKRRQFLKASIGGVSVAFIGGGATWLALESNDGPLTIETALAKLKAFSDKPITYLGEWNVAQIFTHCAQSVEYSMYGFPEHKSALFKNTVGSLAFSIFSSKGEMTHSLSEPIPGAPLLPEKQSITVALDRLAKAMAAFKQYEGELSPHFAYGELSKEEYEIAHVLHFYNHLQEIQR